MKENYTNLEMEIIEFDQEDIITVSTNDPNQGQWVP